MATLDKVAVEITLVLGTTPTPSHQVLRLGHDAIIELGAIEEDARERQPYPVNVAELLPRPPDALNGPPQGPEAAPKLSLRPDGRQALSLNILFVTWSAIIGTRGFQTFSSFSPCGRGGIGRRTSLRC